MYPAPCPGDTRGYPAPRENPNVFPRGVRTQAAGAVLTDYEPSVLRNLRANAALNISSMLSPPSGGACPSLAALQLSCLGCCG